MTKKKEKSVPLQEAAEQVRVTGVRLALMHLAFSKILVEELGEKRGKEAIVKAMIEYGQKVGERIKAGHQDLPFYGFHEKYTYEGQEFIDTREKPGGAGKEFDLSRYRVYGCVLAKTFLECGEKELGCLYCYVDSAKSMAADPDEKLIHTACEAVRDGYCAFMSLPTTEKERKDFECKRAGWRRVDPILVKGGGMEEDGEGT
jgi:hypothetical protein